MGLGFEMARAMASSGAHVVISGRDRARLEGGIDRIGSNARFTVFDVADTDAGAAAIDTILDRYGRLDILVNNVGLRDRRGIWDVDLDSFRDILHTNLVAPFEMARIAAKAMIAAGRGGRIINIGNVSHKRAASGDPCYAASKAGLMSISRALASELGPHRITVNAILPGGFLTEFNAAPEFQAMVANTAGRTILGRIGQPPEIAAAALLLASDAGSYITGAEIVVDGGYLARG